MRETISTISLIFGTVVLIAALAMPLILWRIKDLVLEIRDIAKKSQRPHL